MEHAEVIGALRDAGVLAAIRWAYESAARRALEMYSPADGHDVAWLGNTRYVLFRDRLDRVFSCDRYQIFHDMAGAAEPDPDVLYAELPEDDIRAMPAVAPGLVVRADLHGSPGWACRAGRFLITSGEYGHVDTIQWAYKSLTKRVVALQPPPARHWEPDNALFSIEELIGSEEPGMHVFTGPHAFQGQSLDLPTFVVAHSLDPAGGEVELVFGRPRMNTAGGPAWHWFENLLATPLPSTWAGDAPARLWLVPSDPAVPAEGR
jgi:hypothetical protein